MSTSRPWEFEKSSQTDLFRLAYELSPDVFTMLQSIRDYDGRIVDFVWLYVNPAAAHILRRSSDQLVGHRLRMVLDHPEVDRIIARYTEVVETGIPYDDEVFYEAVGAGSWFRHITIKLGDGVATTMRDITTRKHAEMQLKANEVRQRLLAEVSAALANFDQTTLSRVACLITPDLADYCVIYYINEQGIVSRAARSHTDALRRALLDELERRYPLDIHGPSPAAQSIRTGRLIMGTFYNEHSDQYSADESEQAQIVSLGVRDYLFAPLIIRERTVGALGLSMAESERQFGPQEVALAGDLASRIALAIDNTHLYAAEHRARVVAETARQRLQFLADASVALNASLNYAVTLQRVAELAVPTLGDWCAVDLVTDDQCLERLAVAHIDPSRIAWAQELNKRYPANPNAARGSWHVIRTGQSEIYPEISDELLMASAQDEQHLAILREIGMASAIIVPLLTGEQVFGTLTLVMSLSGRHYGPEDLRLAEEVASRAGLAIEHARLYEVEQSRRSQLAAIVTAQKQAELNQRFLAEASAVLSQSLEYTETVQRLAQLAVPMLADGCTVHTVQADGSIRQVAVAHYDSDCERLLWELEQLHPIDPATRIGVTNVLATRRPEIVVQVPAERWEQFAVDPKHQQMLESLAIRSSLCLPLVARGHVYGTLSLMLSRSERHYGPDDLHLAQELASRAAVALDNARLYKEAQDAVRARDHFLSIASHELKTPLTSLLGYVTLLERRTTGQHTLTERDQRAIMVVAAQARRLNRLITTLLDISRIQLGQLRIESAPLDLGILVRRIASEMQLTTEHHVIQGYLPDTPLLLQGDELRLRQVIENLLENAMKYSPDGGIITVTLDVQDATAVLSVADQGIGIPTSALPQLFRRFYRAVNADGRRISGMGLGLYIIREIVTLHGGSVEVESVEGIGSTFTIRLPISQAVLLAPT